MTFKDIISILAKREGKKVQVSVGNLREVLRHTLIIVASLPPEELEKLLRKYHGKLGKHQIT